MTTDLTENRKLFIYMLIRPLNNLQICYYIEELEILIQTSMFTSIEGLFNRFKYRR